MAIRVLKSTGKLQVFDEQKYVKSLIRAGTEPKVAHQLVKRIKGHLYDKIPTEEIYQLTHQFLKEHNQEKARVLYRLREAIALLDSIAFEKYVARLLEFWGYKTIWNVLVAGKCIEHQVDVVAEKEGKKYLVEVKHHKRYHRDSGLGRILELQARFEDVKELKGPIHYTTEQPVQEIKFDRAWLITNTKFSLHAINYGKCKGVLLSGWRWGHHLSLDYLTQRANVYPLTLFGITTQESARLVEYDLITSHDLITKGIPKAVYRVVPKIKWEMVLDKIKLLG